MQRGVLGTARLTLPQLPSTPPAPMTAQPGTAKQRAGDSGPEDIWLKGALCSTFHPLWMALTPPSMGVAGTSRAQTHRSGILTRR